ncbi:MAG: LLM class F420-dependent oxidoreductase [Acidimicrobiia bacterium]
MSDTRPIRIAAQLHPQHGDYSGLRQAVSRAEEIGYDIVYNWDHFHPLYGHRDGSHFESWTTLAAWAEQTEKIEIGPLVTCNSYRNPQLLADMARTIDHISGGRLILGIGSGWFRKDYQEYGYEFGTAASRLRDLAAALPLIEHRLHRLNPPPLRRPPILIGGTGEKVTLRLVARHADSWHASFPDHAEELEPKVAALLGWCKVEGRDPSQIEWGTGVQPGDLDRFLEREAPTLVDMGFTQFTLGFNGPEWDVDAGAEWLAWRDQMTGPRA